MVDSPWPMFHRNLRHTGRMEPPLLAGFSINNGASNTINHTVSLNHAYANYPTEYMASENASFIGATWEMHYSVPYFTLSPGVGTKTVYMKLRNSVAESNILSDSIICDAPGEGDVIWWFQAGNTMRSSPAIGPDGTLYLGSHDKKLYAIKSDGTKKWEFATGNYIDSSPAIGTDGTVYVGSWDNK
ncbi:PQQ-like beta-propeller repeat protein, partial [Candidatus Poribacteria bacterium]|nr:PQQ-like beta-propeller repeat protein [Candidatus Poribacteria bacterium]